MFSKKILTALGVVATVLTIMGGLWAFDSHYATDKKVDIEIERVEIEVAGALQNQQIQNDYKFYQFMYDKLTLDLSNIKNLLNKDPDNSVLQREYNEVKEKRERVKLKMEQLMERIN